MTAPVSKELGASTEPTALVPGDADAVRGFAEHIGAVAASLEESGDTLKTVSLPSWNGGSADYFDFAFSGFPGLWLDASDILEDCKSALQQYADAITTAQAHARLALEAWQEGEEATAATNREYNQRLSVFNALPLTARQYKYPPHYSDHVGDRLRKEAQKILDDARKDLHEAGNEALTALVRAAGGSLVGTSSQGPGTESSWSWGNDRVSVWEEEWRETGWEGYDQGGSSESGLSLVLLSGHSSAWVWRGEASATKYTNSGNGVLWIDGAVSALEAGVSATAAVSKEGLSLGVNGVANILRASGSTGWQTDYSKILLDGEATAGVLADGNLTLRTDDVAIGGELHAGVKSKVDYEASLGGIGFTGSSEKWAGPGLGGKFNYKFENGKLTTQVKGGASWAVGGAQSVGLTLDLKEMSNTAAALWDNIGFW